MKLSDLMEGFIPSVGYSILWMLVIYSLSYSLPSTSRSPSLSR